MEGSKKLYNFTVYFQLMLGLLFLAAFIFVFSSSFLIVSLFFLLWGGVIWIRIRKFKYPENPIINTVFRFVTTMLMAFYIGLSSGFINTPFKIQYPLDLRYENHYNGPGEQFPASIPKDATDYRFYAFPGGMQSEDYVYVYFNASEAFIATERSRLSAQSEEIFPVFACSDYNLDISYAPVLQEHPYGEVFVVSVIRDANHPHSDIVVFDEGFIFYGSI